MVLELGMDGVLELGMDVVLELRVECVLEEDADVVDDATVVVALFRRTAGSFCIELL